MIFDHYFSFVETLHATSLRRYLVIIFQLSKSPPLEGVGGGLIRNCLFREQKSPKLEEIRGN